MMAKVLVDYTFYLIRKVWTEGCEFEDGADTRCTYQKFFLVPESEYDDFNESIASDYGDQDYSYQVSYKELCRLNFSDLPQILDEVGLVYELQCGERGEVPLCKVEPTGDWDDGGPVDEAPSEALYRRYGVLSKRVE